MREIKFRAWHNFNKKMIDLKKLTPLALNMDTDGLFIPFSDELPIMQFTGLLDKNGKEIYESDKVTSQIIYLFNDGDIKIRPAVVVWLDKLACFGLELDGKRIELSDTLAGWKSSVFEVIGNIYENPELLEAK